MQRLGTILIALGLAGLLSGCPGTPADGESTVTAPPSAAPAADAPAYASPLDHPVLAWNETLLASVRTRPPRPTVIARELFMAHAAMYDAWAAHDAAAAGLHLDVAALRRPAADRSDAAARIAVAHAAYGIAAHFFPEDLESYRRTAARLGVTLRPGARDPGTPEGLGNLAAAATLAARADDGSNWRHDYADTSGYRPANEPGRDAASLSDLDPNRWRPLLVPTGAVRAPDGVPVITDDPASYAVQRPLTPHWGDVVPFGLVRGDEFRPPPPPRRDDHSTYIDASGRITTNHRAWRDQFGEVMLMSGWLDEPGVGPRWKCVAEFWADGPRTESPPGHWNQLAHGLALRDRLGIGETATLYLALTGALHDVAIAIWEAKYHYDFIRPQTAIRHGWGDREIFAWAGPDRGVRLIPAREWRPYQDPTFVTPAFPEYVSGHSGFSMAAATVLVGMLGSDRFYDPANPTTIGLDIDDEPGPDTLGRHVVDGLMFEHYEGPPMALEWPTITAAAEEAGLSRLFGGIHIRDANLRGQEMGRAIGTRALAVTRRLRTPDEG